MIILFTEKRENQSILIIYRPSSPMHILIIAW